MKTSSLHYKAGALTSLFLAHALIASAAFAGYCQYCKKEETVNQLETPAHTNNCKANQICTDCKYYFKPDYACPGPAFSNCNISTSAHIATQVMVVGCLGGFTNCQCPGTGGIPQTATIDLPGETCVTVPW